VSLLQQGSVVAAALWQWHCGHSVVMPTLQLQCFCVCIVLAVRLLNWPCGCVGAVALRLVALQLGSGIAGGSIAMLAALQQWCCGVGMFSGSTVVAGLCCNKLHFGKGFWIILKVK
jgi:hypothetical protein